MGSGRPGSLVKEKIEKKVCRGWESRRVIFFFFYPANTGARGGGSVCTHIGFMRIPEHSVSTQGLRGQHTRLSLLPADGIWNLRGRRRHDIASLGVYALRIGGTSEHGSDSEGTSSAAGRIVAVTALAGLDRAGRCLEERGTMNSARVATRKQRRAVCSRWWWLVPGVGGDGTARRSDSHKSPGRSASQRHPSNGSKEQLDVWRLTGRVPTTINSVLAGC